MTFFSKKKDSYSKGLEQEIERLENAITTLEDELRSEKNKSSEFENVKKANKDLCEKNQELTVINQELTESNTSLISQFSILQNNYLTCQSDLSKQSGQIKELVDNLIYCLQHSEVLIDESYNKENVMDYFFNQIENTLSVAGIEAYEDKIGPVNSVFHKIVSTIETADDQKKGTISRSLGKGFRIGEKCIIEQNVEIFI